MKHTLQNTFGQHWLGALFAYCLLDVMLVLAALGTPFLCVPLGFVVGWFGARRAEFFLGDPGRTLVRVLRYAWATCGVTSAVALVYWGRAIPLLLDRTVYCGSLGVPLILFDPKLSLAGWVVLMVAVLPAVQFSATLAGAYLAVARRLRRGTFGNGLL